ncbi:hypothetical protein C1H46_006664 [Malus baccata]|uniref:non-specific serine/threonine protein kinase n=1 Tax=Malus baccata TaxID=106549 RepID=A0A540N9K1_MALBA|nr:hypothetical protein C1H46_006664 [Malus baccata]
MDISSNNNFISQSVVLLLLCFTFNGISMASDTIYPGQSLSGNQTLTSPGTARGLAYLHEECRDCIIHCDIKPDNILLDAEYNPKLADFGLAKLVGRHHSRILTTMRGTVGYLAPEWFSGKAITPKADVFSYGMLLIEVISGRRNIEGFVGLQVGRPC